jgi:hypothetical protein
MLVKIWEANKMLAAEFEGRLGKAKSKKLLALMAELVNSLDSGDSQPARAVSPKKQG